MMSKGGNTFLYLWLAFIVSSVFLLVTLINVDIKVTYTTDQPCSYFKDYKISQVPARCIENGGLKKDE
jgi:hypothetical protein